MINDKLYDNRLMMISESEIMIKRRMKNDDR